MTDSNSDQSRPRHLTTPEMIKHLDPICLDRTIGLNIYNDGRIFESSADVVQITFDSNGRTNHVLYASNSTGKKTSLAGLILAQIDHFLLLP